MADSVQSSMTDTPPSPGMRGTASDTITEASTSSRALTNPPKDTEACQAALQDLADCLRSTGTGVTITGEGRVITFPMASGAEVDKLEIIKGTDAWHYHNNSFYSDCILEIEGLPRMHAIAGYLSLRSRFFAAMFSSPLRESTSRVVQLTPPHPSTFRWALHHLYTGALSLDHKKLLNDALGKGDADTFWGLYENASFLDCPTLMDECIEVLGAWMAALARWIGAGHETQIRHLTEWVRVRQAGPGQGSRRHCGGGRIRVMPDVADSPSAVFSHPSFQPSNVGAAALVKMLWLNRIQGEATLALRLFMLLSWLDKEECGGQPGDFKELAETINTCASEAIKAGSRLLKPALEAFPSVFDRVITAKLMIPCLEKLEKAEYNAKLIHCETCGGSFPMSIFFDDEVCPTLGHSGSYSLRGEWSCCRAPREDAAGCCILRGQHFNRDYC